MICGQRSVEPYVWNVPLSCVPPITLSTLAGLTDRLWNWRVFSPLFRLVSVVGTADSSCLHRASLSAAFVPVNVRESQRDDVSLSVPSERMTPPSEPSQNCRGLLGFTTSACWSGWRPFGAVGDEASSV